MALDRFIPAALSPFRTVYASMTGDRAYFDENQGLLSRLQEDFSAIKAHFHEVPDSVESFFLGDGITTFLNNLQLQQRALQGLTALREFSSSNAISRSKEFFGDTLNLAKSKFSSAKERFFAAASPEEGMPSGPSRFQKIFTFLSTPRNAIDFLFLLLIGGLSVAALFLAGSYLFSIASLWYSHYSAIVYYNAASAQFAGGAWTVSELIASILGPISQAYWAITTYCFPNNIGSLLIIEPCKALLATIGYDYAILTWPLSALSQGNVMGLTMGSLLFINSVSEPVSGKNVKSMSFALNFEGDLDESDENSSEEEEDTDLGMRVPLIQYVMIQLFGASEKADSESSERDDAEAFTSRLTRKKGLASLSCQVQHFFMPCNGWDGAIGALRQNFMKFINQHNPWAKKEDPSKESYFETHRAPKYSAAAPKASAVEESSSAKPTIFDKFHGSKKEILDYLLKAHRDSKGKAAEPITDIFKILRVMFIVILMYSRALLVLTFDILLSAPLQKGLDAWIAICDAINNPGRYFHDYIQAPLEALYEGFCIQMIEKAPKFFAEYGFLMMMFAISGLVLGALSLTVYSVCYILVLLSASLLVVGESIIALTLATSCLVIAVWSARLAVKIGNNLLQAYALENNELGYEKKLESPKSIVEMVFKSAAGMSLDGGNNKEERVVAVEAVKEPIFPVDRSVVGKLQVCSNAAVSDESVIYTGQNVLTLSNIVKISEQPNPTTSAAAALVFGATPGSLPSAVLESLLDAGVKGFTAGVSAVKA